jgi:hypothetical protein
MRAPRRKERASHPFYGMVCRGGVLFREIFAKMGGGDCGENHIAACCAASAALRFGLAIVGMREYPPLYPLRGGERYLRVVATGGMRV